MPTTPSPEPGDIVEIASPALYWHGSSGVVTGLVYGAMFDYEVTIAGIPVMFYASELVLVTKK